jgi:hypothetical protein
MPYRRRNAVQGLLSKLPHTRAAGARITLIYEPTTSGKVETCVHAVAGEPVVRRTNIN